MSRVIRTRRAGTVYILISIFLGVVAGNSGNNLLYLTTALLLGYMLASGIAGRRNISNAEVSVAFPDEIYAGLPCPVGVCVRNKSRFVSLFLIEVALSEPSPKTKTRKGRQSAANPKNAFFPMVRPGESESRTFFMTFDTRGRKRWEIELSSVYPFNFFVRYWPVDIEESERAATVFPHPIPSGESAFIQKGREKEPEKKRQEERESAETGRTDRLLSESDIVGVRPYMEGDPMKRVHWKSSARTGKLQTRLYGGEPPESGKIIDLDRLVAGDAER
ncbi:MAG: DUF58 domain-containing protein, partial [Synergistaceae bacterium]|nr:DUF58 domain-containing protein [Synergistaceae bacterium]